MPSKLPVRRLHVGCGPNNRRTGWWNVDIRPFDGVDEVFDLRGRWPWGGLEAVFAEHFLEHLSLDEALAFLERAGGALRPGGVLRLSTPNLEWVLATHYPLDPPPIADGERELQTLRINRAFHGWGHRFLWSPPLLARVLAEMNFASVRFFPYGESDDPALRGLESHGDAWVTDGRTSVLVVEARRGEERPALPAEVRRVVEAEFLAHVRSGH